MGECENLTWIFSPPPHPTYTHTHQGSWLSSAQLSSVPGRGGQEERGGNDNARKISKQGIALVHTDNVQ